MFIVIVMLISFLFLQRVSNYKKSDNLNHSRGVLSEL